MNRRARVRGSSKRRSQQLRKLLSCRSVEKELLAADFKPNWIDVDEQCSLTQSPHW